jgi:N6-L-threonylcarbamoyladenine synthase/tRNA threonylcarbamoyladenosine biosynthesis protein TsaB
MKILALDSSTLMGSAALVIDGKVVSEKFSRRQKSHSEVLNTFIDELLNESKLKLTEIDYFAVSKGPGSFTGLRIAGNIAKTLSYSYQKPIVAIDTLTLLAANSPRTLPTFSMINAYKNMVYYGLYKAKPGLPEPIKGPDVIPVKSLGEIIKEKCLVVGDGYATYKPYFSEEVSKLFVRDAHVSDDPMASTLGLLSIHQIQQGLTLDWKSFVPLYIRASEAEENKRGIFIPSL